VLRAFEVMVGQDIGLLKGLSSGSYWDFRNCVGGCILATDFAKHPSFCEQVRELAQEGAPRPIPKQLEMELIIKFADISNVLKPFHVARRWALRITDEFFLQGDVELSRGMPVTPTCNRRTQSRVALQIGFIKGVCAPFFNPMATLYPQLQPNVERLHSNAENWASFSDAELEESRDQYFCLEAGNNTADPQTESPDPHLCDPGGVRFTPGLQVMVARSPSAMHDVAGCPYSPVASSPPSSSPPGLQQGFSALEI